MPNMLVGHKKGTATGHPAVQPLGKLMVLLSLGARLHCFHQLLACMHESLCFCRASVHGLTALTSGFETQRNKKRDTVDFCFCKITQKMKNTNKSKNLNQKKEPKNKSENEPPKLPQCFSEQLPRVFAHPPWLPYAPRVLSRHFALRPTWSPSANALRLRAPFGF